MRQAKREVVEKQPRGSLARSVRWHYSLRRFQPPKHSAAQHQEDGNQLRTTKHAGDNFAAPRIAPQEFEEETGSAVENQKCAENLAIKFLAFKHPGQHKEIRQFDCCFKKLGRLQRDV